MRVFDIDVEATVHVLAYDSSETLAYKEIESVSRNKDQMVNFSLLIHVKQTESAPQGAIQISFAHILDGGIQGRQKFARLPIGEISLYNPGPPDPSDTYDAFRADPWNVRQTIRWNVRNVPTQGRGSYAVLLMVDPDGDPEHRKILDCAYLEVM